MRDEYLETLSKGSKRSKIDILLILIIMIIAKKLI